MWDLIVSVPDHCLPFYFVNISIFKQPIFVDYLMAILRKRDFTSLVLKSYCDHGCY